MARRRRDIPASFPLRSRVWSGDWMCPLVFVIIVYLVFGRYRIDAGGVSLEGGITNQPSLTESEGWLVMSGGGPRPQGDMGTEVT